MGNVRICSNTDGGNTVVKLRRYNTTKKMQIGSVNDNDNRGTVTSDPDNQWTWNIGLMNNSLSTVTGKIYVRITYYCTWSEPNDFSAS